MSDFTVTASAVKAQSSAFNSAYKSLQGAKDGVSKIKDSLSLSGTAAGYVKGALASSANQLDELIKSVKAMSKASEDIADCYEKAERNIKGKAVVRKETSNVSTEESISSVKYTISKTATTGGVQVSNGNGLSAGVSGPNASGSVYRGITGFGLEGKASVLSAEAKAEAKYAGADASVDLFTAKGEIVAGLMGAGAEVGVAAAKGEVNARVGLEGANIHGGAEGAALGAGAEAGIGITEKDGVYEAGAHVGAEAYLAKGEVKGGFTLFGIDFDVKGEGMVGVQAEAGGSFSKNGAKAKLGIGPIELDVAIDWSDFDLTFWN